MSVSLRATVFAVRMRVRLSLALLLALMSAGMYGQGSRRLLAEGRSLEDRGAVRNGTIPPVATRQGTTRPVTTQSGFTAVSPSSRDALAAMAARAGVIFAGRVLLVTRNDAAGFVDVRFHIDQAIRGCPATGAYVMREWAGLWTGKAPRYRVGESLLLLLTARGPSGMSAPIGGAGMEGAIPLVAELLPPLAHGTDVAPPERGVAGTAWSVDLRWVQAHAVRAVGPAPKTPRLHPLSSGPQPKMAADFGDDSAAGVVAEERGGLAIAPIGSLAVGTARFQEQPSLQAVLLLLRAAGGAIHGTR